MYRPVTEEIGPDEPPDFSSDQDMDDDTTNNELSTEDSSSPQRMPYYGPVDTIDAAIVDFSSAGIRTEAKRAQAKGRVYVQCDASYLFTLPGIFKVFQLVSYTDLK